jgi:glucokinase
MEKQLLLAGDIGGTKTIMALFSRAYGPLKPIAEHSFASGSYPDLDSIIMEFLLANKCSVASACFGVAGPVVNGKAKITKLPWQLNESKIKTAHNFKTVQLINDLVATGYGLPFLEHQDLFTISEGLKEENGTIGIVAPGTGLGEAIFGWTGSRYLAIPSEGGHTDFAPTSAVELDLLRFFLEQYDHVSYDRLCSGRGIPDIYDYFKKNSQHAEPGWLAKQLAETDDQAPVIINTALDKNKQCSLCQITLNTFVAILGSEAGNLALKGLTTGGVYLGGGIIPRLVHDFPKEIFMASFTSKGRMSYLLEKIPVKVILNPKAAIIGAAANGLLGLEDRIV